MTMRYRRSSTGAAYAAEHDLETDRQYIVSWLARCRFDLGQWDEAEVHAFDVLGASRRGGVARFVALNTLGWLRARRGDDDVWPLLDEALEIARQTGHLQRLWPCAVARAEAALVGGFAGRSRRPARGDAAGWPNRAVITWPSASSACGSAAPAVTRVTVVEAAEPFASWNRGDALGAAAGFLAIGLPVRGGERPGGERRHGVAADCPGDVRPTRCGAGSRPGGCPSYADAACGCRASVAPAARRRPAWRSQRPRGRGAAPRRRRVHQPADRRRRSTSAARPPSTTSRTSSPSSAWQHAQKPPPPPSAWGSPPADSAAARPSGRLPVGMRSRSRPDVF